MVSRALAGRLVLLVWRLTPDGSKDPGDEPDVTTLGGQVPGGTVQHVRIDNVDDETSDVVQVPRQDDRLGPESGRSDLGDERVTDGSDGQVVETGEKDQDGTGRVVLAGSTFDCSQDTGEQHEKVERGGTPEVAASRT